MAGIKVNVNFKGIDMTFSKGNMDYARFVTANQIHDDMEPFVPYEEGNLRDLSFVNSDFEIVYEMPYAARLFYAPTNWNFRTPGTGPRWDKVAENLYRNDWKTVFVRGMLKKKW